jgi:hypothetical protein
MMATQKEETEAIETRVNFVAMNESTTKLDLWIGNIGASTHMKNTLDGLFDLLKEETSVKFGNGTGLKSTTVGTLKATVEQADGTNIDVTI